MRSEMPAAAAWSGRLTLLLSRVAHLLSEITVRITGHARVQREHAFNRRKVRRGVVRICTWVSQARDVQVSERDYLFVGIGWLI